MLPHRRARVPLRYLRREGGFNSFEQEWTVWPDGRAQMRRWSVVGGESRAALTTAADLAKVVHLRLRALDLASVPVRYVPPQANACYETVSIRGVSVAVLRDGTGSSAETVRPGSPHDLAVALRPHPELTAILEMLRGLTTSLA